METPFDTIDQEVLSKILSSEPFVSVEGVPNFRQVGGFQASSGSSSVKSGYLYRSGELSHISDKGKETLRTLGIKKVFDFRAPHETTRFEAPNPTVDTVEFVRAPVTGDEKFDPISIAKLYVDVFLRLSLDLTYLGRLKKFEMNEAETFRRAYTRVLKDGGKAYGTVFRHMKDHPDQPCLVHCTAGKDRTGVFTALWLTTLGASDEDIAKDYSLTTYGLVPALPVLRASVEKHQVFQDNWQGALNMANSKPQAMIDLLHILRDEFGGVDEYLKTYAGLTDEDITTIRQHYLLPNATA
ncbi:hypothetical protein NLI96_g5924 [Meripilus lineatus]|uniref:Tyrosine specific protein phosphatases domain-containing protein n=1 Tax=Meripilus lineatus TaxID=2056292 RepID=A0AAD5YGG8_9APHY|nr:hypothetical protein NLI96_g5924 [Physisporinus lineatus]